MRRPGFTLRSLANDGSLVRLGCSPIASGLIADGEAVGVHTGGGQPITQRADDILSQHPSARQDPGVVHVEEEVVGTGVHQGVRVVVCGEHPVGGIWNACTQMWWEVDVVQVRIVASF